jgi:hypothetical protein
VLQRHPPHHQQLHHHQLQLLKLRHLCRLL